MSYITFKPNDTVFVTDIGYGTLLDCGNFNVVSIKNLDQMHKKDSIYFDPDLFNSDDSCHSKKSQIEPPQPQTKVSEPPQEDPEPALQPKQKEEEIHKQQPVNIVKVRLESSKAIVHTSDKNIRKSIIIRVKPLFARTAGIINVGIDITKTIQSLKKQIFDQLGLKIAYFFNIKLFVTTPSLNQLSVPSKTVSQYALMESSIVVMTAQHGFCFEDLPPGYQKKFAIPNNAMTFVSIKKNPLPVVADPNVPISLPPPQKNAEQKEKPVAENPPQKVVQVVPQKEVQPVPIVEVQVEEIKKVVEVQSEIHQDKEIIKQVEVPIIQKVVPQVQVEIQQIKPEQIEKAVLPDKPNEENKQDSKEAPNQEKVPEQGQKEEPKEAPKEEPKEVPKEEPKQQPKQQQKDVKNGQQKQAKEEKKQEEKKEKQDIKKSDKQEQPQKKQQKMPPPPPQKQEQKDDAPEIPSFYYAKGEVSYASGRHYWEIKLDKNPKNLEELQVGIANQATDECWLFLPYLSKKKHKKQNQQAKQTYGIECKEKDTVGVLLSYNKSQKATLTFYKNNVGMGICFEKIEGQARPVFGLGSEGQISLDTRAQMPIDAYRYS